MLKKILILSLVLVFSDACAMEDESVVKIAVEKGFCCFCIRA